MQIHPVINISHLKPYKECLPGQLTVCPGPMEVIEDRDEEYEVEWIVRFLLEGTMSGVPYSLERLPRRRMHLGICWQPDSCQESNYRLPSDNATGTVETVDGLSGLPLSVLEAGRCD